jgi:hypothetical protein
MQSEDWVEKGNLLLGQNRNQEALDAFNRAIHST